MVLVDTSVWVHHLRSGNAQLRNLLEDGDVLCHSFIIGELACGRMRNRKEILDLLEELPPALQADHEEVMLFIEREHLIGKGLGYVDAHLLAAANLSDASIWSLDRKLNQIAIHLKVNYRAS